MPDLRRLLRNQAPPRFAEDLVAAIEPTLRFGTAKCSETTVSRLGGRPNLPAETVWPRWGHWNLAFIAQIDLAAIPEIPGLPLPRTGSLHFFYDGEAAGSRPEDKDSARVFYTVEPLE